MSVKSRICVHQSTKCGFSKKAFRRQYFFLFIYVLLTCYHHLRAKLGMYIALCILLNFWQVCVSFTKSILINKSKIVTQSPTFKDIIHKSRGEHFSRNGWQYRKKIWIGCEHCFRAVFSCFIGHFFFRFFYENTAQLMYNDILYVIHFRISYFNMAYNLHHFDLNAQPKNHILKGFYSGCGT